MEMTGRKWLVVLVVIILVSGSVSLYRRVGDIAERRNNELIMAERYRIRNLSLQISYARQMKFEFRIIIDGERYGYGGVLFELTRSRNPFFTDFIFVHTEAEAEQLPDNIVTAWPSSNHYTEGIIFGINYTLRTEEIPTTFWGEPARERLSPEDFGLTYPITVTDLVENWQKVDDLWWSFTEFEQRLIRSTAWQYPHPWR